MEKEKLLEIRNIISDITSNGISEKYISELYKILGFDSIRLNYTNMGNNTAAFHPKYNVITVNTDKSINWVTKTIEESRSYITVSDEELLKSYLLVSLLSHEIEHSKQKLIADKKLEPKYDYQASVYKDMYDIMHMKEYLLPRPISLLKDIVRFGLYTKNAYNFILERNASIEGYNVSSKVALLSHDQEMLDFLITSRNAYMMQGYVNNGDGTLKYTYDTLGMKNKFNKLDLPTDISLIDKSREGLPLSEEERSKVILTLKEKSKFTN